MCVAIATYANRISSILETAEKIVILRAPFYNIEESQIISVSNYSPYEFSRLLKNHKVKTLICGAITGCVRHLIEGQNIKIIPWITGELQDVAQAYSSNRLDTSPFLMPGFKHMKCKHHRRMRKGKN